MTKKRKAVRVRGASVTRITAEERLSIEEVREVSQEVPEVHGKVVDCITHSIEDGMLYFSVRFTDETEFSLRYACEKV